MGIPSSELVERARKNGRMSGQMANEDLLHLLCHRVSPGAGTARTLLLGKMAERSWRIQVGLHTSKDQNEHITLDCDGTLYHLQVDNVGVIYRITPGEHMVLGNEPSSAPGAAPGRMRRG